MVKKLVLSLVILFMAVSLGYCSNYNSWGNTDLNRLLGREVPYDQIHLGAERGGASTMSSTSQTVPVSFSIVGKAIGNSSTAPITLPNGVPGQIITIYCSSLGSGSPTCAITPTTCTGFTTVTMNAAADSATFLYLDDTLGWVCIGSNSVTIA